MCHSWAPYNPHPPSCACLPNFVMSTLACPCRLATKTNHMLIKNIEIAKTIIVLPHLEYLSLNARRHGCDKTSSIFCTRLWRLLVSFSSIFLPILLPINTKSLLNSLFFIKHCNLLLLFSVFTITQWNNILPEFCMPEAKRSFEKIIIIMVEAHSTIPVEHRYLQKCQILAVFYKTLS